MGYVQFMATKAGWPGVKEPEVTEIVARLVTQFNRQRHAVVGAIEGVHYTPEDTETFAELLKEAWSIVDSDLEHAQFSQAIREFQEAHYDKGIRTFQSDYEQGYSIDITNDAAQAEIYLQAAKFSTDVANSTIVNLRATLNDGLLKGEQLWDLQERTRQYYDRTKQWRAELAAHYETGTAFSRGYMQTGREAGVKEKRWVTVGDGRVEAVCRRNAAQGAIPIDQLFASGDRTPLAHPRCRCHIEMVVLDADQQEIEPQGGHGDGSKRETYRRTGNLDKAQEWAHQHGTPVAEAVDGVSDSDLATVQDEINRYYTGPAAEMKYPRQSVVVRATGGPKGRRLVAYNHNDKTIDVFANRLTEDSDPLEYALRRERGTALWDQVDADVRESWFHRIREKSWYVEDDFPGPMMMTDVDAQADAFRKVFAVVSDPVYKPAKWSGRLQRWGADILREAGVPDVPIPHPRDWQALTGWAPDLAEEVFEGTAFVNKIKRIKGLRKQGYMGLYRPNSRTIQIDGTLASSLDDLLRGVPSANLTEAENGLGTLLHEIIHGSHPARWKKDWEAFLAHHNTYVHPWGTALEEGLTESLARRRMARFAKALGMDKMMGAAAAASQRSVYAKLVRGVNDLATWYAEGRFVTVDDLVERWSTQGSLGQVMEELSATYLQRNPQLLALGEEHNQGEKIINSLVQRKFRELLTSVRGSEIYQQPEEDVPAYLAAMAADITTQITDFAF